MEELLDLFLTYKDNRDVISTVGDNLYHFTKWLPSDHPCLDLLVEIAIMFNRREVILIIDG